MRTTGEQDKPRLVGLSPELRQTVTRILSGTVQQKNQRGRGLRQIAGRNVEVAIGGTGVGSQ